MTINATPGAADANSYVEVAEADAYFSLRNNATWGALSTEEKEAALISAMDFLNVNYRGRWYGIKTTIEQALAWPRKDVCVDGEYLPDDEIPEDIKQAQIELALRASQGPLLSDAGQEVQREKVDVLEVEYQKGSVAGTRFVFIDRLLAPYVSGNSGSGNFIIAPLLRV